MTDTPEPASPPCYAQEVAHPETAVEGPLWRKAQRAALIAARMAVPAAERAQVAEAVAEVLEAELAPGPGLVVSLYWPFRGELDLRPWMARAQARGAVVALPVVEAMGRPLRFRPWWPGCAMERGVWNIPQPATGTEVVPDVVIAPLVGFDPDCYRLGYGGGFFDRTLAGLVPRARAIGVGLPLAALRTIHPQGWDVPMDMIVTGRARVMRRV